MSIRSQIESLASTVFVTADHFGQTITWTPYGAEAESVTANVYDSGDIFSAAEDGEILLKRIVVQLPSAYETTVTLCSDASDGDTFTYNSVPYKPMSIEARLPGLVSFSCEAVEVLSRRKTDGRISR